MPRYQVLSSRHPLSFNVPTVWGSALTHGYINKHHRPQRLTLFPATPCWLQHILISLISRCSSRFLMQLKKMPIRREFWRLLSEASFVFILLFSQTTPAFFSYVYQLEKNWRVIWRKKNHISSHYGNPLPTKVWHVINFVYVHLLGYFSCIIQGVLLTKTTYIQPHYLVLC